MSVPPFRAIPDASDQALQEEVNAPLVDAIAAGIAFGLWGDICLVVKGKKADEYNCVFADLGSLQVNGATGLLELVHRGSFSTLDAALASLFRDPGANAACTDVGRMHEANGDATVPVMRLERKYVPISGIAATTLRAVLLYMHTGSITFAGYSIKGSRRRRSGQEEDFEEDDHFVDASDGQSCLQWSRRMAVSAKSVYRAARRFNLGALEDLADRALDEQVCSANILDVLFSTFTLSHPEILEKRLSYARTHWEGVKAEYIGRRGKSLARILFEYATVPGAKDVLDQLFSWMTITEDTASRDTTPKTE